MDAAPFYEVQLHYRGIPDDLAKSHLEGSECCLIHIDNPMSRDRGVWVNPRVRVGYSCAAYAKVQYAAYSDWLTASRVFFKLWENRLRRWFSTSWVQEWVVDRRFSTWMFSRPGREERGRICLVDEMQVLVANGWAHV